MLIFLIFIFDGSKPLFDGYEGGVERPHAPLSLPSAVTAVVFLSSLLFPLRRQYRYDQRLYRLSFDVMLGAIEGEQVGMLSLFHSHPPTADYERRPYRADPDSRIRYVVDKQHWEYILEPSQKHSFTAAIGRTCSVPVFKTFDFMDFSWSAFASGIARSTDYSKSLRFVKHLTGNAPREEGFLDGLLNSLVDAGNIRLLDAVISPSLKAHLRRHNPESPLVFSMKFNNCTAIFNIHHTLILAAHRRSSEGFLKSFTFFEEKGIQFDYSLSNFSNLFFTMQSIDVLQALEKRVTDPAKLNAMFELAEIYNGRYPVVPLDANDFKFHIYLARRFAEKMKGVNLNAVFEGIFSSGVRRYFDDNSVPLVEFLSVFVNELGCEVPSLLVETMINWEHAEICITPLLRFFVEMNVRLPPIEFTNALFGNPSSFEEATAVLLLYLKRFPDVNTVSVFSIVLGLPLDKILFVMRPLDDFIAASNNSSNCEECYSSFLDKHRKPDDVEQFKVIMLWLIKHTKSLDEIPLDLLLNAVSDSSLLDWIMSRRDLFRFGESNYVTLISEGLNGCPIEEKTTEVYYRALPTTEVISKIEMLRNANVPYSESLISEVLDAMYVTDGVSDHFEDDLLVVIEYARKELKCAWDEKVGRAAIPYGKFPKIFTHIVLKCPIHACSCRSCAR